MTASRQIKNVWAGALVVVLMAGVNAPAAQIFSESFEDPVVAGKQDVTPTGWVEGGTPSYSTLDNGAMTGKTDDQFVGCRLDATLTTSSSILSSNLTAGLRYVVSSDVGYTRTDASPVCRVELLADGNVIAYTETPISTANDLSAATCVVDFACPPGHPNVGDMIAVRILRASGHGNGNTLFDNLTLDVTDTSGDTTPPTPGTMTWNALPTSSTNSGITMMATNAVDSEGNGVQYLFSNTVTETVSGWQDSRVWTETGLTPGQTYSYKVKARDKSAGLNETDWSSVKSAECEAHIILYESFETPSILPSTSKSIALYPLPPVGWDYQILGNLDVWHDTAGAVSTPFGEQYVAGRAGSSITATDLGAVLEEQYTYRATFNAGGMDSAANVDKPFTSQAELWAGGTLVASNAVSVTTSDLSETGQLEFIPDAANTNLGKTITLKLRVVTFLGFWNDRGQFDNVKFYAIPPDPTGHVQLDNTSVSSNAAPGTLVGALSVAGTNGTFTYSLESGGDNVSFDIPEATTNLLRTADWITKGSYTIGVIATEVGGGGLVATNDSMTITATNVAEHAAFKVAAEVNPGAASGGELVGVLEASSGASSSFGFDITSGRNDLFEITSGTNLTQVAGRDPGAVGTVNYVELRATNATTTAYLLVGVEVVNTTATGTLFIFR